MPTYEYICADCDYRFEEFQSITAEPLHTCPKCQGSVKRLISAGNGLIFKGSGFYITDYKNASNGTPKSESKSETSSEAKSKPKPSSDSADD